MRKVFVDRSRVITAQRCKRRRWYEYHEGGLGISSAKTPLALCVGGSVHEGLAELLRYGVAGPDPHHGQHVEDRAVEVALADFAQYTGALELDTTEIAAMATVAGVPDELDALLAKSLGMAPGDPQLATLRESADRAGREFDAYLAAEQCALVEAMVRAYARRRLRPLLEQFEVLEVEREGEWLLSEWRNPITVSHPYIYDDDHELWFMSRPDALLRERATNQLYLQSFKTTGQWDVRKARDAEHDMQGLSEGVEVERRLARWWETIKSMPPSTGWAIDGETINPATVKYLLGQPSPPRILGVRYEYLLKGTRWVDKPLTERFQFEARSQRSPLIRGYLNAGMAAGDESWNVGWDYVKEGGEPSKLYYKTWKSAPVWEHMPIKKWIDMLDAAVMTSATSELGSSDLGYKCEAQATGYLATHPLDDQFIPPVIVYRNEDDLRDLIESLEYQERAIAENTAEVEAATDEGERRSLMNRYFPMTRTSCEYPSTCPYVKLCYGGAEVRSAPLESGLYKVREVNHPQEVSNVSE